MAKRIRPHVNPFSVRKEISFAGFPDWRPIWVDVGAARGEFLGEMMQQFPTKNFVFFEIRQPLFCHLQQKFGGFKNVKIFDGNASQNFENVLRPSREKGVKIEKVFINFPDPHLKPRHQKRRFLNENFLEQTEKWIGAETEFFLQTDQKSVFEHGLEMLQWRKNFWKFEIFSEPILGVQTEWEKVKVGEGAAIFRLKFQKKD